MTMSSFFSFITSEMVKHGPAALRLGCLVNVFHNHGMEVTMCLGPSMLPTFNRAGDVVIMECMSVMTGDIERGDVVIAKSPTNPRQTVCKRHGHGARTMRTQIICSRAGSKPYGMVLGKGGDVIAVPMAGNFGGVQRVEVPLGHLWLQGDNKDNSTDSRDYGPVPYGILRGKVFVKVWPASEFGWVKNEAWRSVPAK